MTKILTIEDSAFERKALINMLKRGGFTEVIEAETGEEGIESYKKEKPDIVLLDLRLPGMDGIECFKKLKQADPRVKVIVVTIVTRQDSVDECMKLGAKAYIMKPITQTKLLEPINKVLGKK